MLHIWSGEINFSLNKLVYKKAMEWCHHHELDYFIDKDEKKSIYVSLSCILSQGSIFISIIYPVGALHVFHAFLVALQNLCTYLIILCSARYQVVLFFLANFSDLWTRHLLWNCPQMNVIVPSWLLPVNILLVQVMAWSRQPLPEPVLTQIPVAIWRH